MKFVQREDKEANIKCPFLQCWRLLNKAVDQSKAGAEVSPLCKEKLSSDSK